MPEDRDSITPALSNLGVLSTKENVNLETLGFESPDIRRFQAIITPIEIAGERLGTLFIYKCDRQYEIDDIILCEYGTTVVDLDICPLHARGPGLYHTRALEFAQGIDDDGAGDPHPVRNVGKSEGIDSITELIDENVGGFVDAMLNERLLGVLVDGPEHLQPHHRSAVLAEDDIVYLVPRV